MCTVSFKERVRSEAIVNAKFYKYKAEIEQLIAKDCLDKV